MFSHHDCFLLFFEAAYSSSNDETLLHVEVTGGFIEEVHVGFSTKRRRNRHPLEFAAAEHVKRAVPNLTQL